MLTEKELGLDILEKLKAGIRFEVEHNYINIVGKSGDFTSFIKKQCREALGIFKHSDNWSKIAALISRYPHQDLSTRIVTLRHIGEIIFDLEDFYSEGKRETHSKLAPEDKAETAIVSDAELRKIPVQFVKGVGPKLAEKLNKIGIETCEQLLKYTPRDFISYQSKSLISDLMPDENATIFGTIDKISAYKTPKKDLVILNIEIKDISGKIKLTKYFQGNSSHFYIKQFKSLYPENTKVLCFGKVKIDKFSKKLTLGNPVIEVVGDELSEEANPNQDRIIPIYPLTEGLSMIQLKKSINQAIDIYLPSIKEFVPEDVSKKYELISYQDAIEKVHRPEEELDITKAAERLCFNDFFLNASPVYAGEKKSKKRL